MKLSISLFTCLVLISAQSFASAITQNLNPEEQSQPSEEQKAAPDRQVRLLIGDESEDVINDARIAAQIFAAWNPEVNSGAMEKMMVDTVRREGVEAIFKPLLALADVAAMTDSKAFVSASTAIIEKYDPENGKKLREALGFPISSDWREIANSLSISKRETLGVIQSKYGIGVRESSKMPRLIRDLRRMDISGITAALYGPGSRVHVLVGLERADGRQRIGQKSAIYGVTSKEIYDCYVQCKGPAGDSATVVGIAYGGAGAAFGAAAGGMPTAGIGAGPGAGIGLTMGTIGGGLLGLAHGFTECAKRSCRAEPQPKKVDGPSVVQPSSPKTETPKTEDNQPKIAEDKPKSAPEDKPKRQDPCTVSSKSCDAMVNPNDDRNVGSPAQSDTGPRKNPFPKAASIGGFERFKMPGKDPVIYPVRPDSIREMVRGFKGIGQ